MPEHAVLEQNLSAIGIDEILAKKLLSHTVKDVSSPQTPNGLPFLTFKNQAIYDASDPLVQVEREVAMAVEHDNWDMVAFFGFGLGYHAEQVRRKLRVPIVVFEPSHDLLKTGLAYRSQSVSDLTIVDNLSDLSGNVENIARLGDRRILVCVVPSYPGLFPEAFERFKNTLKSTIDLMNIEENTLLVRGQVWSEYTAANLMQIPNTRPVHALKGRMVGVPGVLVGAGPSLDKNLSELKEAKGKMIICAVNSALKPLASAGVVPDLAVVIESNNQTQNFENNPYLDQIDLVVSPESHPDHFTKIPVRRKMIAGNMGVPSGDWLRRAYGASLLNSGGSVACTSFSLLHLMGCDPIVLMGMDAAFTDCQSHASFSDERNIIVVHNEEKGLLEQYRKGESEPIKTIPAQIVQAWGGNGEVVTYDGFSVYRSWFEQAAISWASDRTVINATEGGAKFFEFEEMTLAETLTRYNGGAADNSARLEREISEISNCQPEPLLRVIKEEFETIKKVAELSKQALTIAKKARIQIKKGKIEPALKQLKKLQYHEGTIGSATKKSRLLNQFIGSKITQVRREKKSIQSGDNRAKTLDALFLSVSIFEILNQGARELIETFETPLDELENM